MGTKYLEPEKAMKIQMVLNSEYDENVHIFARKLACQRWNHGCVYTCRRTSEPKTRAQLKRLSLLCMHTHLNKNAPNHMSSIQDSG